MKKLLLFSILLVSMPLLQAADEGSQVLVPDNEDQKVLADPLAAHEQLSAESQLTSSQKRYYDKLVGKLYGNRKQNVPTLNLCLLQAQLNAETMTTYKGWQDKKSFNYSEPVPTRFVDEAITEIKKITQNYNERRVASEEKYEKLTAQQKEHYKTIKSNHNRAKKGIPTLEWYDLYMDVARLSIDKQKTYLDWQATHQGIIKLTDGRKELIKLQQLPEAPAAAQVDSIVVEGECYHNSRTYFNTHLANKPEIAKLDQKIKDRLNNVINLCGKKIDGQEIRSRWATQSDLDIAIEEFFKRSAASEKKLQQQKAGPKAPVKPAIPTAPDGTPLISSVSYYNQLTGNQAIESLTSPQQLKLRTLLTDAGMEINGQRAGSKWATEETFDAALALFLAENPAPQEQAPSSPKAQNAPEAPAMAPEDANVILIKNYIEHQLLQVNGYRDLNEHMQFALHRHLRLLDKAAKNKKAALEALDNAAEKFIAQNKPAENVEVEEAAEQDEKESEEVRQAKIAAETKRLKDLQEQHDADEEYARQLQGEGQQVHAAEHHEDDVPAIRKLPGEDGEALAENNTPYSINEWLESDGAKKALQGHVQSGLDINDFLAQFIQQAGPSEKMTSKEFETFLSRYIEKFLLSPEYREEADCGDLNIALQLSLKEQERARLREAEYNNSEAQRRRAIEQLHAPEELADLGIIPDFIPVAPIMPGEAPVPAPEIKNSYSPVLITAATVTAVAGIYGIYKYGISMCAHITRYWHAFRNKKNTTPNAELSKPKTNALHEHTQKTGLSAVHAQRRAQTRRR